MSILESCSLKYVFYGTVDISLRVSNLTFNQDFRIIGRLWPARWCGGYRRCLTAKKKKVRPIQLGQVPSENSGFLTLFRNAQPLLHDSKLSLGVNACLPCQPCDKPATRTRCIPPSPCDSRDRLRPPRDHKHSRISRDRKQVDGRTIRCYTPK